MKMKEFKRKFLLIIVSISFITNLVHSQYNIPEKMEWWYEARFGMFIHFGSYSEYGQGEWIQFLDSIPKPFYQDSITKHFNPENFNAQQIVNLAKQAGMKYIVITAKHHEGLAMWKTEAQSFRDYTGEYLFDIYHYLGITRDLLGELKTECDKQGIKFCLYYSILDWNHYTQKAQDYFSVMHDLDLKELYVKDMKLQLKEIITTYHPAVVWFDGDWCKDTVPVTNLNWWNKQDAIDLYDYVLSLDSTIIVNERVKRNCGLGDFMCPEEKIPSAPLPRQWETCQTMNGAWGYNKSLEESYRSLDTLIHELEAIVSRDGNYLLNIGPKGDGSLSPHIVTILTGFGKWMDIYGESIYGAGRSPFETEPEWGYYTTKPNMLYAHVTRLPKDGTILIPASDITYLQVTELSIPGVKIQYTLTSAGLVIQLPEELKENISLVFAIELKK